MVYAMAGQSAAIGYALTTKTRNQLQPTPQPPLASHPQINYNEPFNTIHTPTRYIHHQHVSDPPPPKLPMQVLSTLLQRTHFSLLLYKAAGRQALPFADTYMLQCKKD
jgi:hypothetical protein